MSYSIEGKTAVITGAANGIGLAIARHFARQGANVMFADIDDARLQNECGEAQENETIRFFAGDLREKLTITNLLSATIDAFDRIDILVNASRQIAPTDPLDSDDGSVQAMLDQNLMTALRLSQHVARRMIKQANGQDGGPCGSIVNINTIASRCTHPDLMGYSVAAAAVDQMTRSMAVALAPHRIRVNAVSFGSVMSASLQGILKEHPEYRLEIESHTPMRRIAAPGELAETVQFLACEGSGFMTGQIVTLDGGRTLLDPVQAPAH
ncbi:MAG: SDR family oxidoreductase [Roseivivax sp.]|nr:SDR family oxidoreductase [Roseivivax sp.]